MVVIIEDSSYNKFTDIIKDETEHLNKKKQSVNDVLTSKERMIQLNTNYIERKAQYQKMLIALIIGLAVYILIYLIKQFIPIPDVVVSLIIIIIFSVIAIYCFNIYLVIINRDPMDFDKINKPPPVTLTASQINQSIASNLAGSSNGNADLLATLNMGTCSGSSCCSIGTVWDISSQLCIEDDTFKTMSNDEPVYKVVNQTVNARIFTPSEYDSYSIY